MSTKSPFFPGFTIRWDSPKPPEGWLLRDGRAISRQKYRDLFNVIGTRFGYGNGKTTFNLPDDRNVFPRGASELPSGNGSDKFYFGPNDSIDTTTDIITVMNHGLNRTGLTIILSGSPGPTGPTGSQVWVIVLDEHRFRVANSEAEAIAGTYVDITAAGSGQFFYAYTEPLNNSAAARLQSAPGGEVLASKLGSRQHHGFMGHHHLLPMGGGGGGGYLTAGGTASVQTTSGDATGSTHDVPPYYTGIQSETRVMNINTYWIIKT